MNLNIIPEWAPQGGVMLTWPHVKSDWASNLENVEIEMLCFAKAIITYEDLLIICYDAEHLDYLKQRFADFEISLDKVHFAIAPSNDSWARDHGPICVENDDKKRHLLNFNFNGWGNKYLWQLDNAINEEIAKQNCFNVPMHNMDFILEGGSIEANKTHELLTTTACLMNKNRNNFSKKTFEQLFEKYFGIKKVHWLDHGYLAGDDTDSHVDTLARFVNNNTICYVKCDDPTDEHFEALQKMEQQLQSFKTIDNRSYELIPLPWPQAQYDKNNQRLPLTYANFLIINNAILVPNFNDPADKSAENILKKAFPDRAIIGIPSYHIIRQFGSLHCLSMQLPKGVLFDEK